MSDTVQLLLEWYVDRCDKSALMMAAAFSEALDDKAVPEDVKFNAGLDLMARALAHDDEADRVECVFCTMRHWLFEINKRRRMSDG